jgi:CBS domain containing-hemolysin-like protein
VTEALGLLAVLLLVAMSAYFVAMEFGFTAASRNRLAAAELAGDRKAGAAVAVLRRLSFTLSGAQLGITVAALVTGFIAEPVFAALLEPGLALAGLPEDSLRAVSLSTGFVISTVLLMVLGELAPKNLAIAVPESTARVLGRSTLVFLKVAGPVIHLFDGSANRLLKLVGITPVQESHGVVTSEDLERIIASSGFSGHLTPEEAGLLGRALNFGALTAADVMVPRPSVVTVDQDATYDELRRTLRATGHSRLPVTSGPAETVVGLVSAKDLLLLEPSERTSCSVAQMVRDVLRVPERAPLADVVAQLRRARTQFAVVVDEFGADAGVLTLEDVAEELVGEVRDEYDVVPDHVVVRVGDQVRLPGSWRLHEVAREAGVRLPDGDYDTLAGLVIAELGHLGEVGEEVVVPVTIERSANDDDVPARSVARLRVEEVDEHAISCVALTVEPAPEDEG